MARQETTRLDLRMSRKQRELFKQADEIVGYKSLNDFVLAVASEKADAIIQKHNVWLSSENHRKIFFNTLINPPAANVKLTQAMNRHNEFNPKKY